MFPRSIPSLALAATLVSSVPLAAEHPAPAAPPSPSPVSSQAPATAEAGGPIAEAGDAIAEAGDAIADELALWTRLRDGAGTWAEYGDFLARHPDWPGLAALRRAAERQMPAGQPPETVLAFFDGRLPETGTGSLRLAAALAADGRGAEAEAEIVRAWTTFSMTSAERKAMLGGWKPVLAGHHEARMDMLLWRGLTSEAEAMKGLVSPDWQKLADARILTRRDAEGLQYAIDQVPPSLRNDPGLAYERFLYRVKKGRWQDAEDYLLANSRSAAALGRPEMWMERRANLARQALEDGQVAEAYALAAQSFGTKGADYADAEWVAGFVALTRLDDPEQAVAHFRRFRELVASPISVGRAGYWLGRACEAAGDAACAGAAYAEGARYQTSFYGQLAAEKAGIPADPALAGSLAPPDWRAEPHTGSSLVAAARFLHAAGDDVRAAQFFRQAAAGQPPAVRAAVAQMAIDLGRPEIGIRIGKDAASDGFVIADQYYPLHPVAKRDWRVPTEFAMAIARQESELDATAASGAGARGLMQLMPATARGMADAVGIEYRSDRLTEPLYNARLGTEYLARMLGRYDGSYVLATAAYNAGPGRVDQWLKTIGDPRGGAVDPVIWIESIPFSETRNYVMRVLESLHVYRARLLGRPEALRLFADIGAGTPVQVSTRSLEGAAAEAAGVEPVSRPAEPASAAPPG